MACVEKYRSAGVVSGNPFVGDVKDRIAILVDDLVSTGTTLRAAACREPGAGVHALATHGLFVGRAGEVLADPVMQVVVSDSVPAMRLPPDAAAASVICSAPLFAEAVRRLEDGESLVGPAGGVPALLIEQTA